jgi:hypothetical protein
MEMKSPAQVTLSVEDFYRRVLDTLAAASVEFLLGGAFAMRVLTGIERDTKDFDLMLRPSDVDRALTACREAGFRADYAFAHWIAKVHFGEHFIDLIYRAGNGLCEVDDEWFAHAQEAEVLGRMIRLSPPEEMIWQKAFVMERERYDGADVLHLLRSTASTLDWDRLLSRFAEDWRVLLSYLILYGFVYPRQRSEVPSAVIELLYARLQSEAAAPAEVDNWCRGTLLSRGQYLPDVERWEYRDARLAGRVKMTAQELLAWTTAIDHVNRMR